MVTGHLHRAVTGLFAVLAVALALVAPAAAARPPSAALNSTEGILRWINAYRDNPDPDGLPTVVRTLGALQAFKDAETSGAYVGFIAGVLGANPGRKQHHREAGGKQIGEKPARQQIIVADQERERRHQADAPSYRKL